MVLCPYLAHGAVPLPGCPWQVDLAELIPQGKHQVMTETCWCHTLLCTGCREDPASKSKKESEGNETQGRSHCACRCFEALRSALQELSRWPRSLRSPTSLTPLSGNEWQSSRGEKERDQNGICFTLLVVKS